MTEKPRSGRRLITRIVASIAVVVVLAAVAFGVYANMVMLGDRDQALKAWRTAGVSIVNTDHSIIMQPTAGATGVGLVFIPGAKVEAGAYLYKLSGLVASGATVVITKPTLNLAFFDSRPLSTFEADAPGVTRWFVGGHSLGGVRACQLADSPEIAGLILFGSYCANDLSSADLDVLSVGASADGLSTPAKIAGAKGNLPGAATFVEIDGANHASFGDYGAQPGDGTATIPSADVLAEVTAAVAPFLGLPPAP